MTRNEQTREKFLEVLAEKPFINCACAQIGVSRSTIYRWMKDNYRFKRKVLKAITNGRENVTEIAETALVKEVSRGNMRAIEFFLKYNSKRYSRHADPVET